MNLMYLLGWRMAIICGVAIWLAPVEIAFDAIEDALIREGVEL